MHSGSRLRPAAVLAVAVPLALSGQIAPDYQPRYEGIRWVLHYGAFGGPEQFAVNELQRMVQRYLPYVLPVFPATGAAGEGGKTNLLLIGTAGNKPAPAA